MIDKNDSKELFHSSITNINVIRKREGNVKNDYMYFIGDFLVRLLIEKGLHTFFI